MQGIPECVTKFGGKDYETVVELPWEFQGSELDPAKMRAAKKWLRANGYIYDHDSLAYWTPAGMAARYQQIAAYGKIKAERSS